MWHLTRDMWYLTSPATLVLLIIYDSQVPINSNVVSVTKLIEIKQVIKKN